MSTNLTASSRRVAWIRRFLFPLLGLAALLAALAFVPSLPESLAELVADPYSVASGRTGWSPITVAPGIERPETVSPDKAALDDDAPVIGVSAGGRARAYLVAAFEYGPRSHVINDSLDGVPISVTHCDRSGCSRVFTGDTASQTLDLSVGGLKDGGMVLNVAGHAYRQDTVEALSEDSPPWPYATYPAELTTWGTWRQGHPATDVYLGPAARATQAEQGSDMPNPARPAASP